jgi:hypothetical protein
MFGSSWSCGPKGVLIERERERDTREGSRKIQECSAVGNM